MDNYFLLVIVIFYSLVFVSYLFLMLYFIHGWNKLKYFKPPEKNEYIPISVVIPFRNEASNLPKLMTCFLQQNFPVEKLEIILVNDHSTDNSVGILEEYQEKCSNISICEMPNNLAGKKEALRYGVEQAKGEIIMCTDADCIFSSNWLSIISSYFQLSNKYLVIAPVVFTAKTFVEKIFSLDFQSLVASSAALCAYEKPIMCNGANLAFRKNIYQEIVGSIDFGYVSGDDVFLLHEVKKRFPQKIAFLKNEEVIVRTPAPTSIRSFFEQRIRWASKARGYTDVHTIQVAIIVFFFNLFTLFLPILYFTGFNVFILFISIYLGITLIEYIFLKYTNQFFLLGNIFSAFITIKIFYPLYIITSAIIGLLGKFSWKGRIYNKGLKKMN